MCFVLTYGALTFSSDIDEIALKPIEKMIEKVNQIASNPISAKKLKIIQDDTNKDE